MSPKYKTLKVIAQNPEIEIWVGDGEGNFVCKDVGTLEEGLLPGEYTIEFGLGTFKHRVQLYSDMHELEVRQNWFWIDKVEI